MPRKSSIWQRKGRIGWFATIAGKQVHLGDDHEEAQRRFHSLKASGRPVERSKALVGPLVQLYLEHAAGEVMETTYTNYAGYLQQWVTFAGWRVASTLKPFDLTAWCKSRPGWKSNATRRTAIKLAQRWSKWCAAQGYLDTDPLAGAKAPKIVPRQDAAPGSIERFLAGIECPLLLDLAIVLLETGARPGEISTLSASKVDWGSSAAIVIGKKGPRLISLTDRALAILRRLSEKWPDGPLLRNRDGGPWTKSSMNKRFRAICRSTGVKVVPYHARHAWWAKAQRAGVDSVVAAKQLGHQDLRMLVTTYAHVELDMLKQAVELASLSESSAEGRRPPEAPHQKPASSPAPRTPRRRKPQT
jgi:integrase